MTEQSAGAPVVISVRGEANVEADPELCELLVSVQVRDKDRRTALETLTQRNNALLAEIRTDYASALEKVESEGVHVYSDQRRRGESAAKWIGTARVRVVLKDFTDLGVLVTKLADGEGRGLSGPWWQMRRDSEVYKQARTEAVGEAVQRAHEYAAALGTRITALLELADSGLSTQGAPQPQVRYAMAASAGGAAMGDYQDSGLDVEPVRQTVYASVEARFSAVQPEKI